MKTRLLVLGAGSLTGYKLIFSRSKNFIISATFNFRNPNLDNIDTVKLDITQTEQLEKYITKIKPDIIINCIALNSVDYCESHPELAMKINYEFVKILTKLIHKQNSKLIHLSTDSVFDGQKTTPYLENDLPNPINIYGKSKLKGEEEVLRNNSNLIVRASVLYGWLPRHLSTIPSSSMKPKNFVQWLIHNLERKKPVNIITDETSSPIIADDFAESILHLIKNNEDGIFHAAPPLCIDRYSFSVKLASALGYNPKLIKPVTNKVLGRNVTTAKNKCLDSTKLQRSGFKFLTLEDSFILISTQMTEDCK